MLKMKNFVENVKMVKKCKILLKNGWKMKILLKNVEKWKFC